MKRFSISFKISFWVFALTSLIVITIGIFLVNNYKTLAEEDFIRSSKIKADLMSDNCVIPLAFYLDMAGVRTKLEKFKIYPSIRQCIIYDQNQESVAGYFAEEVDVYEGSVYQDTTFFINGDLHSFLPIMYHDKVYGTIFLCEDTSALYQKVLNFTYITLIVGLLLILIFYLVTRNLQKTVSEPLSRLIEATENVSNAQEFSRKLEIGNNDEIGRLYAGFYKLISHLEMEESQKTSFSHELSETLEKLKKSREEIIGLMHALSKEVEAKNETVSMLEETWQRFELTVKGSNDGLWDWKDLGSDQQWWSPKVFSLLHYSETEIKPCRASFKKLVHPADINRELEMMRDHLESNLPYDIRLRLQLKDGIFRWFRLRGQALWDENNTPVRMSGSIQDIDKQQKLKQQMQSQISDLETISKTAIRINESSAPDQICQMLGEEIYRLNPGSYVVISLYDPQEDAILIKSDFGFDQYRDEIQRIIGNDFRTFKLKIDNSILRLIPMVNMSQMIVMENGIYDLLGHNVSKTVCKLFLRFLDIEEVYHIGFSITETASGGMTLMIPSGNHPQHVQVMETLMNYSSAVLQRIFINQQLQRKQEELDMAINSTDMGMWSWNLQTNQSTYNDKWFSMLGWDREDVITTQPVWENLLHPSEKEACLQRLRDYTDGRTDHYVSEYRLQTKSGNWKWIHSQGKIVSWTKDGEPLLMLGIHLDIDNRRRNEDQVKKLNEELEERVKQRTEELEKTIYELEEFSYSISHDLKAPLRAIGGFAEILREDHSHLLDEEALKLLGVIEENVWMMGQLIEDLLYFVRLSRLPLKVATLDLGLIAWNAYNHLQSGRKKEDIDLTIANLKTTKGDASQIKLLFTHLLENAIKYRKPEGKLQIVVGIETITGKDYYYVKDTGIGFDMQYAHNIFKIFHKLHSSEYYKGTGVGLAIVKRIIEKHNGEIFAESEIDKGTTFYFRLDVKEDQQQST
ncbi:MAG: PAS domain-containing protein [Candidatus Cloacimonetes bacterium]|nr:PAS domain-containing protein [Candidatus Cloacimonadota bacterium]